MTLHRFAAKRPHKYHARATVVDGIRFASQREAKRYGELKLLEKAGEISLLTLQPRYELKTYAPATFVFSLLGEYRADFSYFDQHTKKIIVEDVKGFKTPLYRWKKRHFEIQYGVTIREV